MRALLMLCISCTTRASLTPPPPCSDCAEQTSEAIEIRHVAVDLARGQLLVRGFHFSNAMVATLDGAPLKLDSVTSEQATLSATALLEGAHKLRLADRDSSDEWPLAFVKGDPGPRGLSILASGPRTLSIYQRDDSAHALGVSGAVALTGTVVVSNDAGGLGLQARGQLDFTDARFRLPLYLQSLGDFADGGLGAVTSTPNDVLPDLRPSEIAPGTVYCKAGDLPIGGGCVSRPKDQCAVSVSEPTVTPLSTGHMGWRCRAIDQGTRTGAGCFVTAQVFCLKVHP